MRRSIAEIPPSIAQIAPTSPKKREGKVLHFFFFNSSFLKTIMNLIYKKNHSFVLSRDILCCSIGLSDNRAARGKRLALAMGRGSQRFMRDLRHPRSPFRLLLLQCGLSQQTFPLFQRFCCLVDFAYICIYIY
jgi:hypothetical protein